MNIDNIPTFIIPNPSIHHFKYLLMKVIEGNKHRMILRLLLPDNPAQDRSGVMFALNKETQTPLESICDMGGGALMIRKEADPSSPTKHPGMTVTICAGGNNWGTIFTMCKAEHDETVLEILRGHFPEWNVVNLTPGPTRRESEVPLLFP